MAKSVYKRGTIKLIDGTEIELGPLSLKYLKTFMDVFYLVDYATDDNQSISILSECATICMKQYYPLISTREQLEDNVDLPTIYRILDLCGGIKIDPNKKENIEEQAKTQSEENKNTWEELDLAELEAEAFMLGIWKNFDEMESNISMPELVMILEHKRDNEHKEQKFLAAIQGIDLDKHSGQNNAWEEMKARVFSGGQTNNPDDILTYQGHKAQQAGFGLGMGLDYVDLKKKPSE